MEDLLLRNVGIDWGLGTCGGSDPTNQLLQYLLDHLLGLLGLQVTLKTQTTKDDVMGR